ncbi:TPA: hypothetical protein ACMD15_003411 [Vibrio cholerae]
MKDKNQRNLKKFTLFICLFNFIFVFFLNFHFDFGIEKFSLLILLSHPQALAQMIAMAIGGSLFIPLIHIAISSMFKSQRNWSSRCKILIGWSVITIVAKSLALFNYVYINPIVKSLG